MGDYERKLRQLHNVLPLKVTPFIFIVEQLTHYFLSYNTTINQGLLINRKQLSCLLHLLVIKRKLRVLLYMNMSCLYKTNGLQKTDSFL